MRPTSDLLRPCRSPQRRLNPQISVKCATGNGAAASPDSTPALRLSSSLGDPQLRSCLSSAKLPRSLYPTSLPSQCRTVLHHGATLDSQRASPAWCVTRATSRHWTPGAEAGQAAMWTKPEHS